MQNPVIRVLKEQNMSAKELAIVAGVDLTRVRQFQGGGAKTLSSKVLDTLALLGYDKRQLANEYTLWREELAAEMRSKVLSR